MQDIELVTKNGNKVLLPPITKGEYNKRPFIFNYPLEDTPSYDEYVFKNPEPSDYTPEEIEDSVLIFTSENGRVLKYQCIYDSDKISD
jgi:hypothetical protein